VSPPSRREVRRFTCVSGIFEIGGFAERTPLRHLLCNERVFLRDTRQSICSQGKPQRWRCCVCELQKRLSKLLRITRLLVISFDRKDSGLSGRFSVVGNLLPRIGERTVVHEVGSKETGLDHRGLDSKRREFVVQGLCDSFHSKLGRAVYPPADRRSETTERGEIYDVARLLPAHRWKHGPDDIQHPKTLVR
jgi:hypothetical protein